MYRGPGGMLAAMESGDEDQLGLALLGEMDTRSGLPRPEWPAVQARWLALPVEQRAAAWSAVERAWQRRVAAAWAQQGRAYRLWEDDEVLLNTDLPEGEARRVVALVQRALRVIERCLGGLGFREFVEQPAGYNGAGLDVVVICRSADDYRDYLAETEGLRRGTAEGCGACLREGSVHVAAHGGSAAALRDTLSHQLAHCRLAEWELPTWLEEGLVTHLETAVTPSDRYAADLQTRALHRGFWTPARLGYFFEGSGFRGSDDAQGLMYHLAHWVFGELMRTDSEAVVEFLRKASWRDAGAGAAERVLGRSLIQLLPELVRDAATANADLLEHDPPDLDEDPSEFEDPEP